MNVNNPFSLRPIKDSFSAAKQIQDLHACSRSELHALNSHQSSHRATYRTAQNAEQEPEIPHASMFAGLHEPPNFSYGDREGADDLRIAYAQERSLPTVAQCAAHLEFLEVVYALQHRVIASSALDRTFGLRPYWTSYYSFTSRRIVQIPLPTDGSFERCRKTKWEFFVQAAAARFEAWWNDTCRPVLGESSRGDRGTWFISDTTLPPLGMTGCHVQTLDDGLTIALDVLMIWHSFLLDRGLYEAYCVEAGSGLMDVPFPWISVVGISVSSPRSSE